ncbi:MAG: PepSY domain-containing protein [Fuscovulum sp.]|nr:PepSY domain-containing protein [Fuscovulum sp.]
MKKQLVMMAAAMALYGTTALAVVTAEDVVADLQADGYSWIEVKRGPTQIKVEAVKGTSKIEKIIDIETGRVLQTETENADPEDMGRTGVQIRDRNEDFLDDGSDDSSDDSSDDDSSDDDSSDDNGGDDDEGNDDNGGDDNGGDDDEGNDDNGGDDNGGDDDEGNDDNGGDRGGDDDGNDDRGDDNGGGSNDD